MHGLQVGKLVEDVEELRDTEVQLHLVLTNELNVVQYYLLEAAAEIFTMIAYSFVR